MKLKTIASAVFAAVSAAAAIPSFAGINTDNGAEIFFVAFDANGSYTKDTGIALSTWLGTSGLANTAASNFSFNVGALYANMGPASGIQWALLAVDGEGDGSPFDFHVLSTGTNSIQPNFLTSNNMQDDINGLTGLILSINQTTPAGPALAANGDSFNPKGTVAYYDDGVLHNAATNTTNKVGVSSATFLTTNTSYDASDAALTTKLGGIASFNGTSFGYAVTPVPEPETVALMLAGLGAVGFIARRRKA